MMRLHPVSASELDAELIKAAEAEIQARQNAEDAAWALRAIIAEAEDEYVGQDATRRFLDEMIARADAAS